MEYVLIILGAVLVFLGFNKKISTEKPVGQMTAGEVGKAGCHGYLKIMMIAGGIVLILIGLIILSVF